MLVAEERHSTSRFLIEPATHEDDAALRALFRCTSMGSGIEVSFEREPNYFEALDIQGDRHEVGVIRDRYTGSIIGSGTRILRRGFINGQAADVGYLGDLRIDPKHRNGTLAARLYRSLQIRDSWCDWYYTVIFEENTRALNTIATGRAGLPTYRDCGRILCPGIELRGKLPQLSVPGVILRQAKEDDLPGIVDCLNRNLVRRQFSAVHQVEHFRDGKRWRGLKLEDFRVAERAGKIVGSWPPGTSRRSNRPALFITMDLGDGLRLFRDVSHFFVAPGLPVPGECLSYFYACCVAVDGDAIDIFRALLRQLYNAHVGKKWLYFMIGLHGRDPFVPVLSEYARIPFAGRLFAVTLSNHSEPIPALDGRVPSVEVSTL